VAKPEERPGRSVIRTAGAPFGPYDLEGPRQPEMALLPLSLDRESGLGSYMMRMDPGAETIAHTHQHREEFMVLEGHLVDDDGRVFGPGDHVCYAPGTRHNSRTEDGCLLIVFEWRDDGP
jgi:anti-sigma factor ChrR (cupin superfamily)